MRFTYFYKTSDGIRHEAEIDAVSRDAVFASLREKGIRPIKVIAQDGSRENGAVRDKHRGVVFQLILVTVIFGTAVACFFLFHTKYGSTPQADKRSDAVKLMPIEKTPLVKLQEETIKLKEFQQQTLAQLDLDMLTNYALIEKSDNLVPFKEEIDKAQAVLRFSRQRVKSLFKNVKRLFPSDQTDEMIAAQKIYAALMTELDRSEDSLFLKYRRLEFLHRHRGKWHAHNGKANFLDSHLEAEFNYLDKADPATLRWHKDFENNKK